MTMPTGLYKEAHDLSSNHRDEIDSSSICGCFYCVSTFKPEYIVEWIDGNDTALCPKCGIDSVLPESNIYDIIDMEFLQQMYREWFNIDELIHARSK